jgi:anti-anti-sigma factor
VVDSLSASSVALLDPEDAPASRLEAERLGLLCGPAVAVDGERRMEDWITSNLDLEVPSAKTPGGLWNQLIDRLPALRRAPKRPGEVTGPETSFADWIHFRIAYRRGITVVRLVDRALTKEKPIRELATHLLDLIEAGNHRIVLNFQAVERLATWVVVAVDVAERRCLAADGGGLKICGLQDPLAEIFAIAGVAEEIEQYPDETTALESIWPEPSGPRPLPIEILLALTTAADIPPLCGGAPSETADARQSAAQRCGPVHQPAARAPAPKADSGLSLIVQIGRTKGRPVAVGGPRFLIGRDAHCHLRLGSSQVSKLHAAIERRDGRIVVRDLGSTNGTVLNGRLLRSKEAEIRHGDRIQIGPVVSTLVVGAQAESGVPVEERVAEWLYGEVSASQPEDGGSEATADFPNPIESQPNAEADPEPPIHADVIQDVLVVTPRVGDLDNETAIELLRSRLHALFAQALPRQVVVNLEYVGHLSGQAMGMLLAHHLRLDRGGGALRVCEARARIMAALHQVRLTMLVECHPTLDEAVLSAWPTAPKRSPADD